MPIPAILPFIASAIPSIVSMFKKQDTAQNLLGQGIQAGISGLQNLAARRYDQKVFRQQQAANQQAWTMQNEYNSPVAQMERLREAGLNPKLVYGKGADNTASPINVPNQNISKRNPIAFNPAESLFTAQDLRLKQAQYDNLRANNTVLAQDAILKGVAIAKGGVEMARTKWEMEKSKGLFGYMMDAAKLNVQNMAQNLQIKKGTYEMQMAVQMQGLQKGVVSMAYQKAATARTLAEKQRIYQDIELMKKSGMLKDWELKMIEKGIDPKSPWWMKTMNAIYDNLGTGTTPKQWGELFFNNLGKGIWKD